MRTDWISIKIGHVLVDKKNGTKMTVNYKGRRMVECLWFDEMKHLQKKKFRKCEVLPESEYLIWIRDSKIENILK